MSRRQQKVFEIARPAPNENANDTAKRAVILGALNALGVKPSGTFRGENGGRPPTDPDFAADIAQLSARSVPHDINENGITVSVSVKLDTLVIEVDEDNEVTAWMYEEPNV